jgi:hypothetical protein
MSEVPEPKRYALALEEWQTLTNTKSIRQLAREYGLPRSTLQDRCLGKMSQQEHLQDMQILTLGEEAALEQQILQLAEWGHPCTLAKLVLMAMDLLRQKDHNKELVRTWRGPFLHDNHV